MYLCVLHKGFDQKPIIIVLVNGIMNTVYLLFMCMNYKAENIINSDMGHKLRPISHPIIQSRLKVVNKTYITFILIKTNPLRLQYI